MSKNDKIKKLANAIRAYRGSNHKTTVRGKVVEKWLRPPDKSKLESIRKWAGELKLDVEDVVKRVEGFQTYEEFNLWLQSL